MSDHDHGDAGYDEWLDALADGEGYYLAAPTGEGSLPPRRVCPHTGATELTEEPLPETGTVEAATTVHVGTPSFADDTPYVTAVVDFGPVRLTGVVRGIDPEGVGPGLEVEPGVEKRETTGDPIVTFRPV